MLYYIIYVFQMAGQGGNAGLTSAIIQYVIFLVTTGAVLPVIDRFGRRTLLSKCLLALSPESWTSTRYFHHVAHRITSGLTC